jgi:predicted alpha/beta hydrolase family esterase
MQKVILLNGRFPEKINGVSILDIPECNPNNENNWMGWAKKELEEKDFEVICPIIPEVWKAGYSIWKKELDKLIIDQQTTLVGLSAGAGVLLKYLTDTKKSIKKLILLAPASYPHDENPEGHFPRPKISTSLKDQIKEKVVIFISDDEPYQNLREWAPEFQKELDAKLIEVKNYGHFSFLIKDFPELLEEVLK